MSKIIEGIKALDERYKGIRLESAVYSKKSKELYVTFILGVHFNEKDNQIIREYICKNLPFATVTTDIKKVVCSCDLLSRKIVEFIEEKYRVLKDRVHCEDICSEEVDKGKIKIIFNFEKEVCSHLENSNFFDKLEVFLNGAFCESFTYQFNPKKDVDSSDLLKEEKVDYSRIEQISARYFKVNCVTRLFDNNETDEVMYIADALERTGEIAIAGKIIGIKQKETKNGKPFFIIDFNDGTGRMSGTVFSTKDILKKMEKIQEGSEVVVVGKAEVTPEGYRRYTISSLNYCELPKDFVYKERESRKPPETYLIVKPEPIEQSFQTDMFSLVDVTPECLKGKTFVVLDFETTGTLPQEDKITEIGAVKIVDGKITEKFASMINPERKIPELIVELTGITDEMVADAPKFEEVAGDLYKFCHGSIIIAHNLPFDYAFLKNLSKPLNYLYFNRGIDTVAFARKVLPQLGHHKLNNICEYFGIEFVHHRAYNDAYATAQAFIEMIKLNGKLPEFDA